MLPVGGRAAQVWTGAGLMLLGLSGAARVESARAEPAAARAAPRALRFEPNRGQFEDSVRFLARARGFGLYLSRAGATLSLSQTRADAAPDVVGVRLLGAAPREPEASAPLAGTSNYFVGRDPGRWRTDVESYARVTYRDALPGIDLTFYGDAARELEYDLVLAAGADARAATLAFDGVRRLELGADGSARLTLASGATLRQKPPVAYQRDRRGRRELVPVRYRRVGATGLGFALGAYDPGRELVIDPVLTYASLVGAQNFDQLLATATDNAGNTYAVGYTTGGLFPTTSPLQAAYQGGSSDAVICKLDPTGAGYVYATYLGGSSADRAYAVAADNAGNAYVAGVTYSTNFPLQSAFQPSPGGGGLADGFVVKLNAAGSALLYSTYLGGAGDDFPAGVSLSPATGSARVVGQTWSSNFPSLAPLQPTFAGESDAFVSSFGASGALEYSTFLGGNRSDYATAVTSAPSGEIFVAGWTKSTNFPVAAAFQSSFGGGTDAFLTRVNAGGTAIVSSTYLGGTFADAATGVALQAGSPVVVGTTTSGNFPTLAAPQPAIGSAGVNDGFVTRFNGSAGGLSFSTFLGGSGDDAPAAVAADPDSVYVAGKTASPDFPLRDALKASLGAGDTDAFLAAYTAGGVLGYATYLGGSAADAASGVAVRAGRELHVVGSTASSNFPTAGAPPGFDTFRGAQDGFILRLPVLGNRVAVNAAGTIWLTVLGALLLGAGALAARRGARAPLSS